MNKRLLRWLAAGVLAMLLSGCIPSVELNQRAIVQAIGVDVQKDGYRVTMQIFSPEGSGDSGIDPSKQNAKIISAEGKTISDAIQNATMQQGKKIFYGHNRLLIIGEETAKQGIREVLPFFNNGYQTRPNTDLMIAEGTAEKILTANVTQGIVPAESLQNMIGNHTENGSVMQTRLLDVIEAIYSESRTVAIPKISLTEQAEQTVAQKEESIETVEAVQRIKMNGTAVLKSEKLVGYLNEKETRGLMWLTGRVSKTLVVFPYQAALGQTECEVSVKYYQSRTKTTATLRNGRVVFRVKIDAEGRLNEMSLRDRLSDEKEMERLEQETEAVIQNECEASFTKLSNSYRADPFGYGNLLLRTQKDVWQKAKNNWPDQIKDTALEVEVQLHIDRFGLQTDHRKQ